MASILDEYTLDIENFEGAIAVGMSPSQLLTMFQKTSREMDEWCVSNYGKDFKYVYEVVRQLTLNAYFNTVRDLGFRGNPSALAIINNAIQRLDSGSTIKIVFDNKAVGLENEEDKLNDEE